MRMVKQCNIQEQKHGSMTATSSRLARICCLLIVRLLLWCNGSAAYMPFKSVGTPKPKSVSGVHIQRLRSQSKFRYSYTFSTAQTTAAGRYSARPSFASNSGNLSEILKNVFRFDGMADEPESDPEPEPEVIAELEPQSESEPEPELEPEPEPEPEPESVSLCVIGGGVGGLTASFTAHEAWSSNKANSSIRLEPPKIVLLESQPAVGGRVQSDKTSDGYILDRGFAVFVDQYPMASSLLDIDKLRLSKFLPGALVKIKGSSSLHRVTDPFRQRKDLLTAVFSPVGTFADKFKLLPLLRHVTETSIQELFNEEETDTLSCLKDRYGFSDKFIHEFLAPFLEGIYLAPLTEQSSRMFHFIFKMFTEGSACLPAEGIGAVATQLAERAQQCSIDIRCGVAVNEISVHPEGLGFVLEVTNSENPRILAKSVILASDGDVAQHLISKLQGFDHLENEPKQAQQVVGCLYYAFDSAPPVSYPILILNGEDRGDVSQPINNVCFPSVLNKGYAPEGCSLCSVTVLKSACEHYRGDKVSLDAAVRSQLSTWFPSHAEAIRKNWKLKGMYDIKNAQPGQLGGPQPANINGGRDCRKYRDKSLPPGFFVCGDHMATATLNGALESGVNAGQAAAKFLESRKGE